jgi:hypothetical protein
MNNELFETIQKEVVVAKFKVLSRNLPEETEQNYKETSIRTSGLLAKISTWNLLNTRQECLALGCDVQ